MTLPKRLQNPWEELLRACSRISSWMRTIEKKAFHNTRGLKIIWGLGAPAVDIDECKRQ